jgi:predicted nucleotidyltransferase
MHVVPARCRRSVLLSGVQEVSPTSRVVGSLVPMGPLRQLIEERREDINAVVRGHRGRSVAIFGSVARGEEREGSDIDLLVEFEPGSSLFDLMRLEDELSALLGVQIDVMSAGGLKDRDEDIRREAVRLA